MPEVEWNKRKTTHEKTCQRIVKEAKKQHHANKGVEDMTKAQRQAYEHYSGTTHFQNFPHPHPDISEYRVEVVGGDEETPGGTHTTIGFRHNTPLGVVRENDHAFVDVAALLDNLDDDSTC